MDPTHQPSLGTGARTGSDQGNSACLRMKARAGADRRITHRAREIEEQFLKSQEWTRPLFSLFGPFFLDINKHQTYNI